MILMLAVCIFVDDLKCSLKKKKILLAYEIVSILHKSAVQQKLHFSLSGLMWLDMRSVLMLLSSIWVPFLTLGLTELLL